MSVRSGGWLAPRSGGYTPAKASVAKKVAVSKKAPAPKPPKGGGGVGKVQDRGSR
jgi:hypothetical protein